MIPRRLGLAVAAALGAVVYSPAVATADRPAVEVTLHVPGGIVLAPRLVTIETLDGCPPYRGPAPALYGPRGSIDPQPPGPRSWSVATVLECGLTPGVSPGAVTQVTVHRLNGSPATSRASTLMTADLIATADFADGAQPLIAFDGSNVIYYRPWRGGVDQNYRDKVEEPGASPVALDVFEGPPLTVVAQASAATVAAGATVDFSATVSATGGGPPPPATLSYSWDFDGGAANSSSATPRVSFPAAGTYSVTVEVTDAAGGGGADATLITVNPVANSPATTPPANAPATGPAHAGGTSPGGGPGKKTPAHGATKTKTPAATVSTGSTPAVVKPKAPGHTPTTPKPPSSSAAGPTRPPGPVPTAVLPASGASSPVKPQPRNGTGGSGSGLQTVVGRLISGVSALPLDASPLVKTEVAAPATAPQARPPRHASILPVLASLLSIAFLLGLGARHQLGWSRRPAAVLVGG